MLAPEEKLKFSTKPYLAATPQFKSGSSSPREFLERCLVDLTALEPKIGAFVHLNIEAARNAADASFGASLPSVDLVFAEAGLYGR